MHFVGLLFYTACIQIAFVVVIRVAVVIVDGVRLLPCPICILSAAAPLTHLCLLARVHFHFISVIAKLFVLNIFFSLLCFACRVLRLFHFDCCWRLLLVVFALLQSCLLLLFLVLYAPVAIIAVVSFIAPASIKMFAFAYKYKYIIDICTHFEHSPLLMWPT